MKILVVNGYGEHGEQMSLYVDGEKIATTTIDGSNDCPDTVSDFLNEFELSPKEAGIIDVAVLDEVPEVV